jgi:hypothetical protein
MAILKKAASNKSTVTARILSGPPPAPSAVSSTLSVPLREQTRNTLSAGELTTLGDSDEEALGLPKRRAAARAIFG